MFQDELTISPEEMSLVRTSDIDYRTPIKFGGRVVVDVTVLDVTVEVETRDGRRADGIGSMPMGNAWAWPSQVVPTDNTSGGHGADGRAIGGDGRRPLHEIGHPLEITHALAPRLRHDCRCR